MVQWWVIYVTFSIVWFSVMCRLDAPHGATCHGIRVDGPSTRPRVTGDVKPRAEGCACAAGRGRSASHLTARRARTPRTTRVEARRRAPSVFGVGAAAAPARAGSDPFRRARDCSRCFARRRARLAARVTARRDARRPRRAKPPPRVRRGAPPIDLERARRSLATRAPPRRLATPPRDVPSDPIPRDPSSNLTPPGALAPSLFPGPRVLPTRASPRPPLRPAASSLGRASPSPTPPPPPP